MSLLGMPRRIPAVRQVYVMPSRAYDPSDTAWHPILVVSVDPVVRMAMIVTRTTKPYAKGPDAIVHPAQPGLRLSLPGWWRMAYPKPVIYSAFDEPDVEHRGELDEATWEKVVQQLEGGAG
ncbi:MAG: hypothetical protein WAL41_02445 [Mycobacterium sp.]